MSDYTLKKKSAYRKLFDGSDALFNSCWRQYTRDVLQQYDSPASDADVLEWLETLAAERVNDCGSRFYMYG